jgi:hypothetical protein
MVFVRDEAGGGRLYYADSGAHTTAVAVSPPAPAVMAHSQTGPSLEILPGGELVAVYSVTAPGHWNTELRAQRSADKGATWGAPVTVNDDKTAGPHGWVSTAIDSAGRMRLAWLDSRAGAQGVVSAVTRDGVRFEANRVVDARACQCCSTSVAGDSKKGAWIAYRDLDGKDLRNIAVAAVGDGNGSAPPSVVVSDDGWRIDGCPDSGPRMALERSGALWVAWYTGAVPGVFAAFSSDGGKTFSPRVELARKAEGSGVPNHPEIAVLPGGRLVALYVSGAAVFARALESDRKSWSAPVRLLQDAADPRITVRGSESAVFYTARNGNELAAVAETGPLDAFTKSGAR